jgi:hypothetical protein
LEILAACRSGAASCVKEVEETLRIQVRYRATRSVNVWSNAKVDSMHVDKIHAGQRCLFRISAKLEAKRFALKSSPRRCIQISSSDVLFSSLTCSRPSYRANSISYYKLPRYLAEILCYASPPSDALESPTSHMKLHSVEVQRSCEGPLHVPGYRRRITRKL